MRPARRGAQLDLADADPRGRDGHEKRDSQNIVEHGQAKFINSRKRRAKVYTVVITSLLVTERKQRGHQRDFTPRTFGKDQNEAFRQIASFVVQKGRAHRCKTSVTAIPLYGVRNAIVSKNSA